MFRISSGDAGFDADLIDGARDALRDRLVGRYDADEIRADAPLGGYSSRRRGVAIMGADGSVILERDPWEE